MSLCPRWSVLFPSNPSLPSPPHTPSAVTCGTSTKKLMRRRGLYHERLVLQGKSSKGFPIGGGVANPHFSWASKATRRHTAVRFSSLGPSIRCLYRVEGCLKREVSLYLFCGLHRAALWACFVPLWTPSVSTSNKGRGGA